MQPTTAVTVIVPVYQDNIALTKLLEQVSPRFTCIVVDGEPQANERRATQTIVKNRGAQYLHSPASRGLQIACAVDQCQSPWIWIVHADAGLCADTMASLETIVATQNPCWGRFDVEIPGLPMIAWCMNVRSRLTKICTGDQGMFMHKNLLERIGGMPEQPLMEDIELSRRLRAQHRRCFVALSATITTSPRRWLSHGVVRTILTMWWFRWRYFFGTDAQTLYTDYYRG